MKVVCFIPHAIQYFIRSLQGVPKKALRNLRKLGSKMVNLIFKSNQKYHSVWYEIDVHI